MAKRNWPPKNPGDTETYEADWAGDLGEGETITGSTATVEAGSDVVVVQQNMVAGSTIQVVKLSGGTVRAAPHVVLLGITTDAGNTPHRRVRIKVRDR